MSSTLFIIKSTHGKIEDASDLDLLMVVEKWLRTLSFNKVDLMNTYSTWTIRTSFVSNPDNSVILSGLIWRTSDWVPNKMTCEWIVSVHIKYFNSDILRPLQTAAAGNVMSIRLVKKEQMANDIWVLIPHHTVLLKYQNKFEVQQGWFNQLKLISKVN